MNLKHLLLITLVCFFVGCASKKVATSSEGKASLPAPLYFESNADQLHDTNQVLEASNWLKQNKDKVVILAGHCDERGGYEYNLQLGDRRARSVMKELVARGVSENQLIVVSYGKDRSQHRRDAQTLQKDRRVDFILR